MKNIIIIFLLFTTIMLGAADIEDFFYSVSDNVGFSFLKTIPDAMGSSIAGGGTAGYASPSSYLINPASAPYNMTRGIAFSYINSFGLLDRGFFNITYPVKIGYVFGGLGFSVSDTMQLRGDTPTEEALGTFNFSSVTASAGYGLYISNGVYWGASVRTISENSYMLSKISAVFNTGFIMTFEQIDGFTAGLSFLNIGPNYRYDLYSNDYIVTPFTLRAGISYTKPIGSDFTVKGYGDYIKPNDSQYNASLAGTVSYRDMLSVSGGYIFNDNTMSYSVGLGISVDRFDIRYTLKPYNTYLGFENTLTIMMDF